MLPLDNEHVKGLTKPTELQIFQAEYVEELKRARDSIFIDICNEFKHGLDHRLLQTDISVQREPLLRKSLGSGWKVPVTF